MTSLLQPQDHDRHLTDLIGSVLVPGRHHLLTNFQHDELMRVASHAVHSVLDIDGKPINFARKVSAVWAVTSSNLANTRRNPLPMGRREAAIERFSATLPIECLVYPIEDMGETDRFADHIIKSIDVQSEGAVCMTPHNTVVATSTPSVIAMFEALGFRIMALELAGRGSSTFTTPRAWELVQEIAAAGDDWRFNRAYRTYVHESSARILERYNLGDLIVRVNADTLLGSEGDLTATRDYGTYNDSFDASANRKFELFAPYIEPGRIADVGCAGGALIKRMQEDPRTRESDFIGIEVTRRLYAECQRRKENGWFKNENTFFYQRNVAAGKVLPDNSVNTFTTAALTHELFSYIDEETLRRFLGWVHDQLVSGGVYINVDVVGPENKDQVILLALNEGDGLDTDPLLEFAEDDREGLAAHIDSLSTYGRFVRFARDFRRHEGERFGHEFVTVGGKRYARLTLERAAEFLSKKDYADNWLSEMHERFAFWSFADWKRALEAIGFELDSVSNAYRNEWIVENRWKGRAELFTQQGDTAVPMDYPVTNVLLVARKR